MKPRLFTPGPTPVPEETLLELAKPVTYHRSAEAKAILAEVSEDLKYVFQTAHPVYTLTCSGTGGMEAAVSNALAVGEKAILCTAGRWGERWRGAGPQDRLSLAPCVSSAGRDAFRKDRHPAPDFWSRIVFAENRHPFFGTML